MSVSDKAYTMNALHSLQQLVSATLLTDPTDIQHYALDASSAFKPNALAVVFPQSTQEVAAIVQWANQHNIALVPSGGRTGLSGGAVATNKEVVVSLEKMNRIIDVNATDQLITCEAGVITATLQEEAEKHGLFYPVDFASSGSSQIGGNVATNAGGIKVIRYGMTRDYVAGLEVVTGNGEILQLNNGLTKNNTGYDLRHLLIGSEGTLGIITQVTMRVINTPPASQVMLLALDDIPTALNILNKAKQPFTLVAAEIFSDECLAEVKPVFNLPQPCGKAAYYLLIEYELPGDGTAFFSRIQKQFAVIDGVLSQSKKDKKNLWRYRELISQAIASKKPYKNDVSVKVSLLPEFTAELTQQLQLMPGLQILYYGHIGDGNLHINVVKKHDITELEFTKQTEKVSLMISDVVAQFNGSISAEHGIGLLKKHLLYRTQTPEQLKLLKQIKSVFDPQHILNPSKVID